MSEEKKEHICVLCNNALESKDALKEHFRKHANKEIDSKGRALGPNGELLETVKQPKSRVYERGSGSKLVDGEITCDICGEKFKCNTMAIQHKFRKHPNHGTKFYCPQCGMQFPLKIHRDKHLLAHSPKCSRTKVTCNDCGEVFFNKNALEYHHTSTHQKLISLYQPVLTPPPSKKIKVNNAGERQSVYYCHICGFEYIVKFNLQKHLERQHTKEERENAPLDLIKCTTCEALFYSQRAYQNHNLHHRPDDLYVLNEQQRLAVVSRVDQDFDIRRCVTGPEKYLNMFSPRRRPRLQIIPKVQKKQESSDEMSPPSSMDTSSESESELPLSRRLNNQQKGEKRPKQEKRKRVKLKKKSKHRKSDNVQNENIKKQIKNENLDATFKDLIAKYKIRSLKIVLVRIDENLKTKRENGLRINE